MTDLEQRLRSRLTLDLRGALKSRDATRISALRSLLAALDNAHAVPPEDLPPRHPLLGGVSEVPRRILTDAELLALFAAELDERRRACMMLEKHGQLEDAERVRTEIKILGEYAAELHGTPAADEDSPCRQP